MNQYYKLSIAKVIGAIFLSILPIIVQGQSWKYLIWSSELSHNSVVREIGAKEYIVCCTDNNTSSFHWISLSTSPVPKKTITLDTGIIVTDIAVVNNYVVFCGNKPAYGIMGWFDNNQLKGGLPVDVNIAEFDTPSTYSSFFTRGIKTLTSFNVSREYHAVMIGYGDSIDRQATLIDIFFTPGATVSSLNYKFLTTRFGDGIELFESVTTSDDYVVSSGRHKFQSKPGYRKFNKPSTGYYIFDIPPLWHTYNWIRVTPLSPTFATCAGGNRIVVVLDATDIYMDIAYPVNYALCVVRPGTAYSCRYLYKSYTNYNIFGPLRGAAGASDGDVHVMQDVYINPDYQSLVFDIPLMTGGINSTGLYEPSIKLQSITVNDLGTGEIATIRGDSPIHPELYTHTNPANSGCMSRYTLNLYNDSVRITEIDDPRPLDIGSCKVIQTTRPVSSVAVTLSCSSSD